MKFICCVCLFALASVFLGCNSSSTVSGRISVDGTALESGEVMFHPEAQGAIAIGSVVNGTYTLSTGQSDEVAAGEYKVTVVAHEKVDPAEVAGRSEAGMEYAPKRITPEIYADVSTTPLSAEVKAGANRFNFELKSQP